MTDLGQIKRIGNFLGLGGPKKVHPPSVTIGIIGASKVSTYAVIWPSYRLHGCSVVAVAARDADRASEFARWHRIPRHYGSYDELLADPEVDAVYIGLPNGLHGHWAKRSLEAGKHVLVEKPFSANEKEAKAVMSISRQKGLLCREAFHYREHPLHQRLKTLIKPQETPLGRIQRIDTKLLIPRWLFGSGNIRYDESLAGGAMMDAGAYTAHVSRSLASAAGYGPISITSAAAKTMKGSNVIDGAMIVNWTAEAEGEKNHAPWHSWLRGWRHVTNRDFSGSSENISENKTGKVKSPLRQIRGQMHVSLQGENWLPISDVKVTGTSGSLLCQGFVVPFFGHVIKLDIKNGDSLVRKGNVPAVEVKFERAYGDGQSTYFYQLQRFVADVEAQRAPKRLINGAESLTISIKRDISDCIANMRLLDQSYLAAGFKPREPSNPLGN